MNEILHNEKGETMEPSKDISIEYIKRSVKEPDAAGIICIETHKAYPAGHAFYTDWIDTGLGSGHHVLTFFQVDDKGIDSAPFASSRLLFGDMSVFKHSSYIVGVPFFSMGAFLEETSGRFQLGAVLKTPMAAPGRFAIGWQACREVLHNEKEKQILSAASFHIENAPTSIKPGYKYVFRCACPPADRPQLQWQVNGEDAGVIDENGIYTAPERQGVFEIRAFVPNTPLETSVYVVVKA